MNRPSWRLPRLLITCAWLVLACCFLGAEVISAQQTRTVSGRVTSDETAEPLASVQVTVDGTTLGTISGEDGRYSLEVPRRDVALNFRLIGYRTVSMPVAVGQSTVDVTLQVDVLRVDELVVTGRATSVARRNLANAVSTLQGEELVQVPQQTVQDALYGKVAGANVQRNSGAPGGGLQIELRGVTTAIGEHRPLYVVDGVILNNESFSSGIFEITRSSSNPERGGQQDNAPNRIADLNPNDIASIEILKGAAAAAQYGSKASNGVVIITTKRGRAGRPEYNVNVRLGVPEVSETIGLRRFETREEAAETFGASAAELWSPGAFFDHEKILAGENPLLYDISASTSGAAGPVRYYASGLAQDEGGVVIGTGYRKQSLRLNLSQNVGERLSLDLSTNAIHTETARGFTNNDNSNISYWMTLPFTPSFVDLRQRPDGTWPQNPTTNSNPLHTASLGQNDEGVWRFIGSLASDWEALSSERHSLRLLARAGIDFLNQQNSVFTQPELQFEPNDGLPGTSIEGDVENQNVNLEANVVYELAGDLAGGFRATASGGVQFEIFNTDFDRITSRNLLPGQRNVDQGTVIGVLQRRERIKDLGFFFQQEVLLAERLFVSAGFRADQSSTNTFDDELFFYPKAAASYVFPALIPGAIEEVKLRVAYGESGNRPLFGEKFTPLAGRNIQGLPTLEVAGQTASELRPERQREIEGGVDLILFGNRATAELTFFQKNVTDLLVRRELAPSTGFDISVFNGGEARVRGFEGALSLVAIQEEDVTLNLRGNLSFNRSKVTELPVPPFQVQGFGFLFGTFVLAEGESLTSMWGNVTLSDGTVTTAPIGDSNPDFRAGFTTDFQVRSWRFHSVWDWQKGSTIFNLTQLLFDFGQNSADCDQEFVEGESVCARRLRLWPTNTEVYLESASFLKARELGVTYEVPASVREKLFGGAMRSLAVSLTGRNLITITPYPGMDPEVSNFGSQAIGRNMDVAPYPPSRSFWFTVSAGL